MNIIKLLLCLTLFLPGYMPQNNYAVDSTLENESIVGAWTMCKTKQGNHFVLANICSEFVFNKGGTGHLEYANGDKSNFNWIMDKELVRFSFPTEKDKQDFVVRDTVFTYKKYFNTFEHLELENEASQSAIYLGRVEK